MSENYRQILDAAAGQHIPDTANILPQVKARLLQHNQKMKIRRNLGIGFALILLALVTVILTVPAVAQALKDLFGFIPGIGVISRESELRVLSEPVSVTRQGITITVTQAVLAKDKTVILYEVKNIPENSFTMGHTTDQSCGDQIILRLPDGSVDQVPGQDASGNGTGYSARVIFHALPADVNQATLLFKCIPYTRPGTAPENWQIPLKFIAAPASMTVAPIVNVSTPTGGVQPEALTVDKVINKGSGYILIGSFHSVGLPGGAQASGLLGDVTITDSTGQVIPSTSPTEFQPLTSAGGTISWIYEIHGETFAWPLTITVPTLMASIPGAEAEFHFDAGAAPQVGQVWIFNLPIDIGGYPLKLLDVQATAKGYTFHFKTSSEQHLPAVNGFQMDLGPLAPTSQYEWSGSGDITAKMDYPQGLPSGSLTVKLKDLYVVLAGPWKVQWQP